MSGECDGYESCFNLALEIAKEAGKMIKEAFYAEKHVLSKSTEIDLVTETDKAVETMVFDKIRKMFPDHCCIGEESASEGVNTPFTDHATWIVDPIDGTTNFVHSFPYTCISIAFAVNKRVEFGVVYNPILDDLYTARRGRGSFHNGNPIHVSKKTELSHSLIVTEYGNDVNLTTARQLKLDNIRRVLSVVHGIRSLGSAALNLCFVAQGSAELLYEYGIHCWDYAAGQLIVCEAGGVVMDTEGGELNLVARRIIAANCENVARQMSATIQTVDYPHDCQ